MINRCCTTHCMAGHANSMCMQAIACTTSQSSPAESRCDGSCMDTFQQCYGPSIGLRACCQDADACVSKDATYAQCIPRTRSLPIEWQGTLLLCSDGTHTSTLLCAVACSGKCDSITAFVFHGCCCFCSCLSWRCHHVPDAPGVHAQVLLLAQSSLSVSRYCQISEASMLATP